MEKGYEDIYSERPYYDAEIETKRVLLHMMYVPPVLRGKGKAKALFQELLLSLPNNVEFIRLKSAKLGSGCTLAFWKSLGFTQAYVDCDPSDEGMILHLGVNGFDAPPVESLLGGEERHYIFD